MYRRLIPLSLLLLISCSKEELWLDQSPDDSNESKFVSFSETFSPINLTTSFYRNQEYVSETLSKQFIRTNLSVKFDGHSEWFTFHRNVAVTDLDNDGKQDVLAFASSFCDVHDYSYHKGKYIFISDYKGSSVKEIVDSDHYFGSGDMAVNDYDGDGKPEVLFYSTETKMNTYIEVENIGGSGNFSPLPPTIIYYQNGIKFRYVGFAGDSHTGTSGDIDNDGDVDFIQWPIPSTFNYEPFSYSPLIQSNFGGSFIESNLVMDVDFSWYATATELFDINLDGNLDLIVGWRTGIPRWGEDSSFFHDNLTAPIILLGDGSGKFYLSNSIQLSETVLTSKNISASVLGYGFTDYDSDGDIDIIVSTTRDEPGGSFEEGTYYDNYYLILFENQNGSFVDVTDQKIDGSFNQSREFPNFYKIKTIDIDQDGDIDFIPDAIANWGSINYSSNLYWENTGGKFVRTYR